LFEDIQDSADNETRFAVIGHQKTAKTGNDKTTLMFRIPHSPGSLADAIGVFKSNKVNLAWIESFPSRIAKNEYIFFADFEGHIDDPKISKMLKAFHDECTEVTVLGSYPIAQISG
jgi:chorismate mutase/prephenate dehydratase